MIFGMELLNMNECNIYVWLVGVMYLKTLV